MLKHGLTEEQIEELKETFNYLDTHNTGTLSLDELGTFLFPAEDDAEQAVKEFLEKELSIPPEDLRVSGSASITFPVFLTMFARKLHQVESAEGDSGDSTNEEEIKFLFEWFDKDNDGSITKTELQDLMASGLGEHLSEEEVEQMVANADKDDDDEIS
jgi:Ca2+-binding EF-hand superfamily protein